MEKLLAVLAAVLVVVGFSVVGFAREPNVIGYAYYPDTVLAAIEAKEGASVNSHPACGIGETYSGMIAWVETDQHSMTVRGQDGSKIFDVSQAEMKGLPEAGQFVTVTYTVTDGYRIASSVRDIPRKVAWMYIYGY